jgi:hypothetical protein
LKERVVRATFAKSRLEPGVPADGESADGELDAFKPKGTDDQVGIRTSRPDLKNLSISALCSQNGACGLVTHIPR